MGKALSRALTLAAFVGGMHFASVSHGLVIEQMFDFGDSLTDSGSAAAMTGGFPPSSSFFPPSQPSGVPAPVGIPYNYQFSNGPVAAQYLADFLKIAPSAPAWPASPANSNPNFAVGGGMSGAGPVNSTSPPIVPDVPAALQGLCCNFNWLVNSPAGLQTTQAFLPVRDTGLNNQVALFGSRLASGTIAFNPATTLFWVWGGPNDVFLALALVEANPGLPDAAKQALLEAYTINAALNIGARIGELAALNAQHFLVLNMPNMGATPFAADEDLVAVLTSLSILFNFVLDGTLDALRSGLGLDIIEFDSFAALNDLIMSGAFANTQDPCFDADDLAQSIPRILGGCQGYLFFDGVHPTTAAHLILAQQLYSLVPEPGALALLAAALLALAWVRRASRA
jgi:phospholipase/lecithinase/hemolysin